MRLTTGPVNTLGDALRANLFLWALCRGCGKMGKIKPLDLISRKRTRRKRTRG